MRIFLIVVLFFCCFGSAGQNRVPFGGSRTTDTAWCGRSMTVDSLLRLLRYATRDTNMVLGIDSNGHVVLRSLLSTTAGVSEWNNRTGAVTPLVGDYASFYIQGLVAGDGIAVNGWPTPTVSVTVPNFMVLNGSVVTLGDSFSVTYSNIGGRAPTWNQSTTGNAGGLTSVGAGLGIAAGRGGGNSVPYVDTGIGGFWSALELDSILAANPYSWARLSAISGTGAIVYSSSTGKIGLATTGTAGTYGSATAVPVFTTDVYGRITNVTSTSISVPYASLTGTVPTWNQNTTGTAAGLSTSGAYIGLGTGGKPYVDTGLTGLWTAREADSIWTANPYSWIPLTAISGTGAIVYSSSTGKIGLGNAGTAGTYGSATAVPVFTTDVYGRITSVTSTSITYPTYTAGSGIAVTGSGMSYTVSATNAGTVTSVTAGAGLSGGTITSSGTINLPTVGTAGTYGNATTVPVFTTDAYGRITSVTSTGITFPSYSAGRGLGLATSTFYVDSSKVVYANDSGANKGYMSWYYGFTNLAPLASPTMTGTPAVPTASINTNTTQVASTAYVDRYQPVVINSVSATTITAAITNTDVRVPVYVFLTAQASNITIAMPTGTADYGQICYYQILCNSTGGYSFTLASGISTGNYSAPSTLTASNLLEFTLVYGINNKWLYHTGWSGN